MGNGLMKFGCGLTALIYVGFPVLLIVGAIAYAVAPAVLPGIAIGLVALLANAGYVKYQQMKSVPQTRPDRVKCGFCGTKVPVTSEQRLERHMDGAMECTGSGANASAWSARKFGE